MLQAKTELVSSELRTIHNQDAIMQSTHHQKRSRFSGWKPLVYPASALVPVRLNLENQKGGMTSNPHFPLHEDVLRAAARELFILDGIIEAKTLKLVSESLTFHEVGGGLARLDGPAYLHHLRPNHWVLAPDDHLERKIKTQPMKGKGNGGGKKRILDPSNASPRKKGKTRNRALLFRRSAEDSSSQLFLDLPQAVSITKIENSSCTLTEMKMHSAESLVDVLIERSLLLPALPSFQSLEEGTTTDYKAETCLRKVSDVDGLESKAAWTNDVIIGDDDCHKSKEISMFFNLHERNKHGSFPFLRTQIPLLLEVSIVSESILKEEALRMTSKMICSFDEKTVRLFLGYKSSALKRDRLQRVLAEYLFDVSHAMFAWEQTQFELSSDCQPFRCHEMVETCKLDIRVRDALFDDRALKKIGGFEDSSLLPHALSICRLRSKNVSWEAFAKSSEGQRLFRHHRDGDSLVVGLKRRAQRVRNRYVLSRSDLSDEGRRSRSSSIASLHDELETVCEFGRTGDESSLSRIVADSATEHMPGILQLTLRKLPGKSWGVLLSKEGDICVVVRAPDSIETIRNCKTILQCGDLILSVTNECGESAFPPSSDMHSNRNLQSNWFRVIVTLFKTSDVLHLVIRRLGSFV